jgi:hypothetical protein
LGAYRWVQPSQVSKSSPNGPMLPGQVYVTGKKHFLPPSPLLMGYALLFQVGSVPWLS